MHIYGYREEFGCVYNTYTNRLNTSLTHPTHLVPLSISRAKRWTNFHLLWFLEDVVLEASNTNEFSYTLICKGWIVRYYGLAHRIKWRKISVGPILNCMLVKKIAWHITCVYSFRDKFLIVKCIPLYLAISYLEHGYSVPEVGFAPPFSPSPAPRSSWCRAAAILLGAFN